VSVDRQRELIAAEARQRQAEEMESLTVPVPGAQCRVDGCAADTRLGTLQGGGPMLCGGAGQPGPCIARWLLETDIGSYEDWLASEQTRDY
jgi:hypothetical protein